MKELNGAELASFIKERQAKAVRGLRQAWQVFPKLAIIVTTDDPVIDTYVSLKKKYAEDILIDVEVYRVKQEMVPELLDEMKKDASIHGVIIQLPLGNPAETEKLCALIPPEKDVDALGDQSNFDAATPTAINWLLTGYDVDLVSSKIVIVGRGKLVGEPLLRMYESSGLDVESVDVETKDKETIIANADIVVTATGSPASLTSRMIKPGATVVDAGSATVDGNIRGDVADDLRARDDIQLTPVKGGVGPLTITALFENLITAARGQKGSLPQET